MVLVCMSVPLCASCAPIPFNRSTAGIELATVTYVVQFVWPTMFLAYGTLLITRAYLFWFFGDAGADRLHLALTLRPFWFNHAVGLSLHSALCSFFSRISRRAQVLTGVDFSIKSYWVCHLAGHMHSKCVAMSASSKGNTCFMAGFALRL